MPALAERKDDVIQIRTSSETKSLFQRAAELRQQKLSEFMLESARISAQETILSHSLFRLDDKSWDALNALLDNPPAPSPDVAARFARNAVWTK